ncbi:MAG: T9SS type A sorting domain-containing protein [Candidatus Marinimicrobia bacterium]|nr:T9SS type A sorting domain-containing protein [Candidatus Neomarinimicrobiota bacterium]MCF7903443.1 T9SS type A sorting domain-containing protein [Candidatus Neomarinimicrobiota bacterium]
MILILLLSFPVWGGDGYWIERSSMPEPRSQHAAVVVDGTVYLTGGRTSGPAMMATRSQLWAYHPDTDEWSTNLPEMSEPREDHVMVATGDTLWVFGGRNHNTMVSSVIYWIVGSEGWQLAGEMPLPREGMGVMTYSGKIYLIGGKASHAMWASPVTQVDEFNPQSFQWTISDTLQQARVGFAWAAHGDTIMCAGGRFLDPLASVERRIDGNAWESATPLNGPRSDGAAVFFRENFVLLSGIGAEGQAAGNQEFDGTTWQSFESNLLPRFEETAVVVENSILVMGGRNGNQLLASTEQYIPFTKTTDEPEFPAEMALINAYPNPFNGSVRVDLTLSENVSAVQSVNIYNVRGQLVYQHNPAPDFNQQSHLVIRGENLGATGVYVMVVHYWIRDGAPGLLLHKLTYLK